MSSRPRVFPFGLVFSVFLLWGLPLVLSAQSWQGTWSGRLTRDGKPDTYIYTIEIEQEGEKVFGTATSKSTGNGSDARFEIGGIWDGHTLTIQEVKQLEPSGSKWCLKHIRLQPVSENGITLLKGRWEATGCTPGEVTLRPVAPGEATIADAETPPIAGKYTGTLSQSDRDYGFYFELILRPDGTGTSNIISDGPGGNATHQLEWTFDPAYSLLRFTEIKVVNKSVPDWPWCIKTAELLFQKEPNRISLAGQWEGFIEGFDTRTGRCAPGKIYLEKPVFKKEDLISPQFSSNTDNPVVPKGVQHYRQTQNREVEVNRVMVVNNNTVRVRVWDNGVIDGDVLSLFINGKMILENFRVTRRKYETIVHLDKPVNYLILHAISLGRIKPNTVAVSVDDGTEEQVVIISSNLTKSGAIMIRQFTVSQQNIKN